MSWPLMRAEIEERSTSEAATAGSVAEAEAEAEAVAAASAGAADVAAEACSTDACVAMASLAVSVAGVVVVVVAAESSFLLPPPQPHRDSDLEDETPPSTIGAAAAYRVRNGDEAVVNLAFVFRSEVPNWRPWLSCRLERFCFSAISRRTSKKKKGIYIKKICAKKEGVGF